MPGDSDKRFRTERMEVTAYLHNVREGHHGVHIRAARRVNGTGRFEFIFSDPEGMAAEMAMEFASSESRQFDDGMKSVKGMMADWDLNNRRSRRGRER